LIEFLLMGAAFTRFADDLRRTTFFTACIDVARRILPASVLTRIRSQMVCNLTGGPREVFTEIFRRNIWGYQETVSGGGSTLHYTKQMREALPKLIGDLDVGTLLDLPCGDFHWMSEVKLPVTHYIGGDIVPRLVEVARVRYGRAEREFRTLDLCKDVLPQADLLLCRDCLIHLSEETIFSGAGQHHPLRHQISADHHPSQWAKPLHPHRRLVSHQPVRGPLQLPLAAAHDRRLGATVRPAAAGAVGDRKFAAGCAVCELRAG
jgi:hypothetical protein